MKKLRELLIAGILLACSAVLIVAFLNEASDRVCEHQPTRAVCLEEP